MPTAVIVSLLTFVSTFLGGLVGLKYKDKLHLILGLTAGVLLGVVSFDIFPEIFELVNKLQIDPIAPMIALVSGFFILHVVEKLLFIHRCQKEECGFYYLRIVGIFYALGLCGHLFMDGVGIGLGFQVSGAVGMVVAIAVISHDFSD